MPARNRILLVTATLYGLAVLAAALLTEGVVGEVAIIGAVVVGIVSVATRPGVGGVRNRNRARNRGLTNS